MRLKEDNITSSFILNDSLNSDFWKGEKLDREIRVHLLKVAKDFKSFLKLSELDLPAKVIDVYFTGSLANCNWSEYSDIDLHLIIQPHESCLTIDQLNEYLQAKKQLWNDKHDVTIKGFQVEVYPELSSAEMLSDGIYSIIQDKWIRVPGAKNEIDINEPAIERKSKKIIEFIDKIESCSNPSEVLKAIDVIRAKIADMRKNALRTEEGAMHLNNLVFKYLRRAGQLDRLANIKTANEDAILSLNESVLNESSFNKVIAEMQTDSWGIITAYRGQFDRKQNILRNRELRGKLDQMKMGVQQLIGHWIECEDANVSYKDCPSSKRVDVVERSYFVVKSKQLTDEEFLQRLTSLMTIQGETQDAILFGTPGAVYVVFKDGSKEQIGTKATIGKISQGYSQHIRSQRKPFVFEHDRVK